MAGSRTTRLRWSRRNCQQQSGGRLALRRTLERRLGRIRSDEIKIAICLRKRNISQRASDEYYVKVKAQVALRRREGQAARTALAAKEARGSFGEETRSASFVSGARSAECASGSAFGHLVVLSTKDVRILSARIRVRVGCSAAAIID